jgi:hypothetical protein
VRLEENTKYQETITKSNLKNQISNLKNKNTNRKWKEENEGKYIEKSIG